jgi:hypothetical protein
MGQYKIFHDHDHDFISIVHEGKWTLESSNELMKLGVEMSEKTGVRKVLIDHRKIQVNLSITEIFERGINAIKMGTHLRFDKTAMVQSSEKGKLAVDYRFLETVLRNRGVNIKIFLGDINAARDWLNASD